MQLLSAQEAMGGAGGIIIWVVILVVFMFVFMIRPQRKEQQRKNDMMSKMAVGDTVLPQADFTARSSISRRPGNRRVRQ